MQLEMAVTGHVSAVADGPYVASVGSPVLRAVAQGAGHQLQELASELGTLFLVRRRLQVQAAAWSLYLLFSPPGRSSVCTPYQAPI